MTQPYISPGGDLVNKRLKLKLEEWKVVKYDNHPGYINLKKYQLNQERIAQNNPSKSEDYKRPIRSGAALLQGCKILCGKCGRRMSIIYPKIKSQPVYTCDHDMHNLTKKRCQWISATEVDWAVEKLLLLAISPAQLEISLSALEQIKEDAERLKKQFEKTIERARYEADRARRYLARVEPENRLVARALEREWNDKLQEVERLEHEYDAKMDQQLYSVSPAECETFLDLARELPTIWHSATTTQEERKKVLRIIFKEIFLEKTGDYVVISVRWASGADTKHVINYPSFPNSHRTDSEILDLIRALAVDHTDQQIASHLNSEGILSLYGKQYTKENIKGIRLCNDIPSCCPEYLKAGEQRGDGRYNTRGAARNLNLEVSYISQLCRKGKLDAIRSTTAGPWWIRLTPETIDKLRKPEKVFRKRTLARRAKEQFNNDASNILSSEIKDHNLEVHYE